MRDENANSEDMTLDDVVAGLDNQETRPNDNLGASGDSSDNQLNWDELPKLVKERIGKQQHKLKKLERENAELRTRAAQFTQPPPQNHYSNSNADYNQQETVPDFDAMLESAAERVIIKRQNQQKQTHLHQDRQRFESQLEQASFKYNDFEEAKEIVGEHEAIMAGAQLSPYGNGPDVVHYLHSNATEFERIIRLPPLEQTRAVLKLGADLALKTKKVTQAPPPMRGNISGKGGTTVDANSTSSIKDYIRKQYQSKYDRSS